MTTDERYSNEVYLGDGLYAGFSGYDIRLRAPQGNGTDMTVYLDDNVMQALLNYLKHLQQQRSADSPAVSPKC